MMSQTNAAYSRFVNEYLKVMGPIVRRNHGFIDKYIGDAVNPPEIQTIKRQTQKIFEDAARLYAVREFARAKALFEQVLEDLPGDLASKSYILRCDRYASEDLPANWDGALDFDFK